MERMTPFSNGTDFCVWQSNNCHKCANYEDESTNIIEAKCKAAFEIDYATVSDGKISMKSANYIGLEDGRLKKYCNNKK